MKRTNRLTTTKTRFKEPFPCLRLPLTLSLAHLTYWPNSRFRFSGFSYNYNTFSAACTHTHTQTVVIRMCVCVWCVCNSNSGKTSCMHRIFATKCALLPLYQKLETHHSSPYPTEKTTHHPMPCPFQHTHRYPNRCICLDSSLEWFLFFSFLLVVVAVVAVVLAVSVCQWGGDARGDVRWRWRWRSRTKVLALRC